MAKDKRGNADDKELSLKNEIVGVFSLFFSFFLIFSLASYTPRDPSFFHSAPTRVVTNFGGRLGSELSALLFNLFGYASLLFIAIFFFLTAYFLFDRRLSRAVSKGIGFAILLLSLAGLLANLKPLARITGQEVRSGGLVGLLLNDLVSGQIKGFFAAVLFLCLLGVSLVLIAKISIGNTLAFLGRLLARGGALVAAFCRRRLEQTRRNRDRRKVQEKYDAGEGSFVFKGRQPLKEKEPASPAEKRPAAPAAPARAVVKRPSKLPEESGIFPELEQAFLPDAQYQPPPLTYLDAPTAKSQIDIDELEEKKQELSQRLQEFKISGEIAEYTPGPVITTFEFVPDIGVKVKDVSSLTEDLALVVKAQYVRIERILGKKAIGIEIPNKKRETIHLRELLETPQYKQSSSPLTLALGKTATGGIYITDLREMPHLIVAGSTGSGKSSFVNSMLVSLARSTNADEVRMILSNLIGPQYDFRDLSRFGMLANARVKAVDAIANTDRLNNFYRLSQFAPHGHMVDGDNLDDVYWEVRRFAEGIGAKPQDIAPYLDNLIMNTRNRVERYELIYGQHGIIEGVLKSGLEAKGVGRSEVNEILSAFRGGTDIAGRRRLGVSKSSELLDLPAEQHVLDSVLKGTNQVPLTGKTQEEALLTHMLLSGKALVMPDYRNVRKAINMFAQAERYAKRNLTSDPNARAEFSRLLSDVSNATISTWRNAVLITGARAVRDLADLQVRFGGAGGPSILTHPFAFFSNAVSATVARESATRSRELMKSAPLLFVPTIAKRMRRSAPGFEEERYRNSFLIDARGLQNLLTDDLPSDMSGATKWQSRIQIEQGREAQQFATDKDFFADISRRGVIDPIVIVYDRAKDGYRISDGAKRAQAAYRMRLPAVPVKIVSGAIEDGQSFVKARTAKSDKWGRWANVNGNDGYYIGGVRQVVEQGRKAVRDSMIYSLGLRGLAPVADQEWARANGLGYFDDFNAVLLGQESDDILSDLSNQSTTFMGNFSMDQSLSTGRGSTLSMFGKDQPAQHANYAKTWADRAGELRALPHIGDLLNGRKSLDDVVEEIVGNPAARDEYLGMLNAGSLRSQKVADSDELLQILRAENDQLDQFIRGQYQMTLDAIADLAGRGNHVDLFDAIVAGRYGEKPLNRTNRALTSRIEALLQGDKSPNYVDQYLPDRLQGVDETLFDMSKSIVDRVFDAQGEVMDVFGMVGPQRQKYKEHVLDLARYLSDADRQKMARLIEGRGDDKFAREVLGVRSTNSVESMFDPDTIDRVAMRRATEDIKEVFYDAHKRRNWALALRAVSPFAQAAVNTVYTWGKLMLRNPENAYRTYKPVQALMEPESDVISDILDFNLHEDDPYSIGKGFFAEDPVSGMRTFQYPIVNSIAGKILNGVTGGADTDFVFGANAQSLNPFQSGIAGGVSPLLTVPLGTLDPQAALRDNMLGMFLRFQGASPSASDDPIEAAVEQFVPLKLMDLFTRGERKKSELIVSNYAAEVASGRWNVASPGDRERALSAATSKANWQMIAEGVIEIFAPTFGSLNTEVRIPIGGDFAADGSGKVVMRQAAGAMLYTEARDRLYDYIKNPDGTYKTGDELRMAKNAYFEDYGIGPLMAARAMIMDKETLPRSSEAYDLYTENTEWFNAHSDVIRYLFPGEQVYGPNLEASISRLATYYERKNGARYLSGKDMQEIVQKEFAETWAATAGQRAAARNGNVLSPYSDDAIRDEAAKFGGGWPIENPDQPKNVLRKIEDSLAELPEGDRDLIPGYEYIDSYLKERKRWDNPSASYALYALGRRYVGEDKSGAFSTFWFRVAGDEFTETTKATSSWMD